MKKLVMVVAMLAVCGMVFAGENLVQNGDFSQAGSGNIPAKWRKGWSKVQGTLSLDKTIFKSSPTAAKIENSSNDQYTFLRQTFAVKPNTEYIFSCWMKGKDIKVAGKGGAQYWILKNGGKTFRDGSYIGFWTPAKGTFDWSKVMIAFKTKDETSFTVMVGLTKNSTGTVWFDDVQLMEK